MARGEGAEPGVAKLKEAGFDPGDLVPLPRVAGREPPVRFKLVTATAAKELDHLREVTEIVARDRREGDDHAVQGAGRNGPEELWDTTLDPTKRTMLKVTMTDALQAEKMFRMLMGNEVEGRREFILQAPHRRARTRSTTGRRVVGTLRVPLRESNGTRSVPTIHSAGMRRCTSARFASYVSQYASTAASGSSPAAAHACDRSPATSSRARSAPVLHRRPVAEDLRPGSSPYSSAFCKLPNCGTYHCRPIWACSTSSAQSKSWIVAISGMPDSCADLPLVPLAGLRHQPLLDEVQHRVPFERRAFGVEAVATS